MTCYYGRRDSLRLGGHGEEIRNDQDGERRRIPEAYRRSTRDVEGMAELLRQAEIKQKAAGGKPNTLSIEDRLLMTLEYWREYRTYFHIAYRISESAAYRNIKWCEDTLAKSKAFRLPGRKAVAASERVYGVVLIDATETPIECPSAIAYHDCSAQKASDATTRAKRSATRRKLRSSKRILCIAHDKGRRHDFRLFKKSKVRLHPNTKAVVDSGFQGLQKQHADMPKQRSKKNPLSKTDKTTSSTLWWTLGMGERV